VTKQNIIKFGLRKINAVKAKQHEFYELSINGVFQLEEFERNLEEIYSSEYKKLLTIMDACSNGVSLPHTKMKDITPNKDSIKEYEFKSKNLRIYAIQQPGSKLVIFCGHKNNQKAEIRKFRSIKQQFLEHSK
jgi:hypothetical protein